MDNQSIQHTRWNCTYHIVFILEIQKENNVWKRKKRFGRDNKQIM